MQDRLAHRLFEGHQQSGERGNEQQMPNANPSEQIHRAEKQRQQEKTRLGDDKNLFAIAAIDHRTTEGREKYPWQAQTESFEAEVKGRVRELKNQPALRRRLDQSAGVAEQ